MNAYTKKEAVECIREASNNLSDLLDTGKIRHPLPDELDGIAYMLEDSIKTPLPKTPPDGLIHSMVIRYDHCLGLPGYYDQPIFSEYPHKQRYAAAITLMGQLYEEVSGHGFYKWEESTNE